MQTTTPHSNDIGREFIAYSRRRLLEEFLPRIQRCVDELSEEDFWWRAHETDNSVGNLLLHLCGNMRQWIISGIGGAADHRQRDEEFSTRTRLPKHIVLKNFETVVHDAVCVLEQFNPATLLEMRHIQQWDASCLDAISHVVEHVAEHMGQIIYITKLRKGIDLRLFNL